MPSYSSAVEKRGARKKDGVTDRNRQVVKGTLIGRACDQRHGSCDVSTIGQQPRLVASEIDDGCVRRN